MQKSKGKLAPHDNFDVPHWNEREDNKWQAFQFKQPYARGVKRLREEVLSKTNFDPATLWQWGTMQAMAVIGILKKVETQFGAEGQAAVYESLREVGYDIGQQTLEGTNVPDDMTDEEWVSFYTTVMNTIVYASLESPEIVNKNYVNFHIDWCPHQDQYEAFDCRVQRYFVQGMIDAAADFLKGQGRESVWDIMFQKTIPSGSKTCFFHVTAQGEEMGEARWAKYTRLMELKAIGAKAHG